MLLANCLTFDECEAEITEEKAKVFRLYMHTFVSFHQHGKAEQKATMLVETFSNAFSRMEVTVV